MPPDLFDMDLRALRRDRAARLGRELFLYERLFDDCLERMGMMQRGFGHALLIGCPDARFEAQLGEIADTVDVLAAANGGPAVEDRWEPEPGGYDLVLAVGTLDTVNDLPRALLASRLALAPDGLLIGAMSGGDTLPQLRAAMRAADQLAGVAAPHIHPRIEPAALVGLLGAAGFERAVVDVDRVPVSYRSLDRLVSDLRRMAATNILSARPRRPLSRLEREAAVVAFRPASDGRTIETFEFLHFAGWAAPSPK